MKIFVTVGTQLPFDRLVQTVDSWAADQAADVFAQIGDAGYLPEHMDWLNFVDSDRAKTELRSADLVVSHAGMGSILTRCETGLPIIVMPRRAALGEHRNEHQLATSRRLSHLPGLTVVEDEAALLKELAAFSPRHADLPMETVASPALLSAVREFVSAAKPT